MSTVRLRATWIVEYDADPKNYDGVLSSITPQEMARIDSLIDDVVGFMSDADDVSFKVEPAPS
jgi:hypothetical protein